MSPEKARQKLAVDATPARNADVDGVRERVPRRVALRLLPFLFLLYVVAFLDRMNVGAAALQMPQDLGFSDQVLGLGAGIFFLGYFLLQIPGALAAEHWSARRWISAVMFLWGILTVVMAFIQTEREFYAVRFLVGVAEAGDVAYGTISGECPTDGPPPPARGPSRRQPDRPCPAGHPDARAGWQTLFMKTNTFVPDGWLSSPWAPFQRT